MTILHNLRQSSFGGSQHAHSLIELPVMTIRQFKPRRPCFVNRTALDGIRYPYRVDEIRLIEDRFYFLVSGRIAQKQTELLPIELRQFRSGRWCVGNDEINQMMVEWEAGLMQKAIDRALAKEGK